MSFISFKETYSTRNANLLSCVYKTKKLTCLCYLIKNIYIFIGIIVSEQIFNNLKKKEKKKNLYLNNVYT